MTTESITRYFKNENQTLVVAQFETASGAVATTNRHILVDPDDLTSAAVDGWEEITAGEYEVAKSLFEFRADQIGKEAIDREAKDRKDAYDEAIALGFSPKAASTMSGHVPE